MSAAQRFFIKMLEKKQSQRWSTQPSPSKMYRRVMLAVWVGSIGSLITGFTAITQRLPEPVIETKIQS